MNIDPDGRKLKLFGSNSVKNMVLAILSVLTGEFYSYNSSNMVKYNPGLGRRRYSKSFSLINAIINSSKMCTIKFTYDTPYAYAESPKNATNGKGSNTIVYINTNYKGIGYIILAHELIHAFRAMTGATNGSSNLVRYSANRITYYARMEELLTVGIISGYWITENMIRREHGLSIRLIY